jgi:ubiquinone/menaquinone biosynthesis C-methylase UbiE
MSDDEGSSQIPPPFGQTFPDILAPFVPTSLDVVTRMLKLAGVSKTDVVYDLGCGDGRVLIEAAKCYGASGVGVDVEPYRVAQSQANAKMAGVDHLVTFKLQDAQTVDLSTATAIMLYLVHWSTQRLQHQIVRQAKAGTRVVSHNFSMDNWVPKQVDEFVDHAGDTRKLYLWIVESSVTD